MRIALPCQKTFVAGWPAAEPRREEWRHSHDSEYFRLPPIVPQLKVGASLSEVLIMSESSRVVQRVIHDLRGEFERQAVNEDPGALRVAIRGAAQLLDDAARRSFRRGTRVSFTARSHSVALTGTVVKVNVKNISVQITAPSSHAGQVWRVSPSLLSVVAAAEVTGIDPVRAADIAREACAEERYGADECEARMLVEKRGVYLFFVETPAHGYFISVADDCVGRFVGEEDCGIPDARVRDFFGVGRYAEEFMDWVSGVPESASETVEV